MTLAAYNLPSVQFAIIADQAGVEAPDGANLVEFCDDKGDETEAVSTVEAVVADASKGYWEVKVNGEGIDL